MSFGSTETTSNPDRVVARPKGVNSFDPEALKRCCRVLVETNWGRRGEDETLDAPLVVSENELREVDAMLKQQMQQKFALYTAKGIKMKVLSWPLAEIVRINGVGALKTTYTRSMNDEPPVIVNGYVVQNNDCIHTITTSWRLSERNLWEKDLGKVIDTFKFKKRQKIPNQSIDSYVSNRDASPRTMSTLAWACRFTVKALTNYPRRGQEAWLFRKIRAPDHVLG